MAASDAAEEKQSDIYRDGLLRYAGYANEVGESFKPLIPRGAYLGSYAVSAAYVVGDAQDKYRRQHDATAASIEGAKALAWQGLASVILPGFTINRIVALASRLAPPPTTRLGRYAPTAVGLACIPLIIRPIDRAVDLAMDTLLDPLIHRAFHLREKTGS
mmetsp:Transcript_13773/g.44915  ORF Transcript_13773/g.44915 Transcript_13773/m.44915 type:complete len:160 (+) Transcript_13773:18-497(+)